MIDDYSVTKVILSRTDLQTSLNGEKFLPPTVQESWTILPPIKKLFVVVWLSSITSDNSEPSQ